MGERCGWVGRTRFTRPITTTEWGVPEHDSRALWEKLILDGFQAGLSWITILRKRDNFRTAFQGFDPDVIAGWGASDVERLLADPGIVRHRGKIEATIGNARAWQRIEAEKGFDTYLWDHVGGAPIQNRWTSLKRGADRDRTLQTNFKGSAQNGIQILRADHRLCFHAGGGDGERSSCHLPLP